MSKVLLFGLCPLPFENTEKTFGPGLRTWQFTKALLDSGHEVILAASRIPWVWDNPPDIERQTEKDNFTYYQFRQDVFESLDPVQKLMEEVKPDCLVGATIFPSFIAASLNTDLPLWVDCFGHVLAEAQAKVYTYRDNKFLNHFWRYEVQVLDRGDVFCNVARRQAYATIGELGTRGRLNRQTSGYEFTRVIPCALEDGEFHHSQQVVRGIDVPEDAFIVLSSGGYNTWMDVDCLFEGVEAAMKEDERIYFVSTGGAIAGHDEKSYPHFCQRIENSPCADRFVLKGWLPKSEVPNFFFEADLAINIDKPMYEGLLGSRNRFLNWMKSGLPFVTTELCELSEELGREGLCLAVSCGSPEAVKVAILNACNNRKTLKKMAQEAKNYAHEHFSIEATTQPLIEWVADPQVAPDRKSGMESRPLPDVVKHHDSALAGYAARLEEELRKKNDYIRYLEKSITGLEGKFHHAVNQPWMFALYKLKEKLNRKKNSSNR